MVFEMSPGTVTKHRTNQIASERKRVGRWLARVDDRFMGTPIDISPHEAILSAMRIAAGEVAYCDAQMRRLEEDELFERPLTQRYLENTRGEVELYEEKRDTEELNRWAKWRQTAMNNMVRFAKMAIEAGVEERQIALAEQQAQMIAQYFERVAEDLDLTPEQRRELGPSMRRHLQLVESV